MQEMQKETLRETQSLRMRTDHDHNKIYTGNAQITHTKNMQAQLKMPHLTVYGSERDKIYLVLTQIPLILRLIFR
jgi:hypothetical protein